MSSYPYPMAFQPLPSPLSSYAQYREPLRLPGVLELLAGRSRSSTVRYSAIPTAPPSPPPAPSAPPVSYQPRPLLPYSTPPSFSYDLPAYVVTPASVSDRYSAPAPPAFPLAFPAPPQRGDPPTRHRHPSVSSSSSGSYSLSGYHPYSAAQSPIQRATNFPAPPGAGNIRSSRPHAEYTNKSRSAMSSTTTTSCSSGPPFHTTPKTGVFAAPSLSPTLSSSSRSTASTAEETPPFPGLLFTTKPLQVEDHICRGDCCGGDELVPGPVDAEVLLTGEILFGLARGIDTTEKSAACRAPDVLQTATMVKPTSVGDRRIQPAIPAEPVLKTTHTTPSALPPTPPPASHCSRPSRPETLPPARASALQRSTRPRRAPPSAALVVPPSQSPSPPVASKPTVITCARRSSTVSTTIVAPSVTSSLAKSARTCLKDKEVEAEVEEVGNRPFACEFCEEKFLRKNDLNRHRRIHTGERPYTCPTCPEKFMRNDALLRHLANSTKCASCAPSRADHTFGIGGVVKRRKIQNAAAVVLTAASGGSGARKWKRGGVTRGRR